MRSLTARNQWRITASVYGAIAAAFVLMTGCGGDSDRVRVTGTLLRHDNSPLVGAQVVARSEETGVWASGITDAQGQFVLGTTKEGEGLPPGEYQVTVTEDRGDRGPARPPTIAAKYQSGNTSGLTLIVEHRKPTVFNATLDPPARTAG